MDRWIDRCLLFTYHELHDRSHRLARDAGRRETCGPLSQPVGVDLSKTCSSCHIICSPLPAEILTVPLHARMSLVSRMSDIQPYVGHPPRKLHMCTLYVRLNVNSQVRIQYP
jgi:hypothetical protein